ncbi:MAG TPA: helix-turn-helix transcriptional regulator [bacterium]|nr:helix-turn-helix transcriptional regulator [bacterium]
MAKDSNSYIVAGSALKRLRKEKGFTLEELAERAEISTSYLSHIERGTRQAPLSTLEKLAQILGANFYDLFVPSPAVSIQEKPSTYDAKIKDMLKQLTENEKKSLHGLLKQFHKKKP